MSNGIIPAISPMIFTNSVHAGITILALFPSDASRASNFLNNWALPTKYLSAASFTSLMASASPSACNIFDCLKPSASLILVRFTP